MKTSISVENDMNKANDNRKSGRGPRRSRLAALVLGCAAVLSTNPVSASGWPVFDFAGLMQAIMDYEIGEGMSAADVAEYKKQYDRWQETMKQYQQALVQIQAQFRAIGLPEGQPLVKVDPKYMVAETCGGQGMDFSLTGLLGAVGLTGDQDLKKRQQQICVNIRMMEKPQVQRVD